MNGLKKLLKRSKSTRNNNKPLSEVYIYTPLPDRKNGYIIEFRHPHFSEIYYYKYKDNVNGTLTKYGYLICDHYNRNYSNSKYRKNHKDDVSEEIDYKTLFNSNDKECIFYQTVADKVQIALEKRWMNELKEKGKLEVSAYDDDGEWSNLMQHNSGFFISDNIQRRRLAEILDNIPQNQYSRHSCTQSVIRQLSDEPPTLEEIDGNEENCTKIIPKNMNIRHDKNIDKERKFQEEKQKPKEEVRKLVHLTQPKFSKAPMVHIYDPEDTLVYKDCKCEYCLADNYNE